MVAPGSALEVGMEGGPTYLIAYPACLALWASPTPATAAVVFQQLLPFVAVDHCSDVFSVVLDAMDDSGLTALRDSLDTDGLRAALIAMEGQQ